MITLFDSNQALGRERIQHIGIIIGFIVLIIFSRRRISKSISLEMWGVIDEPAVFTPLINSFQKNNRNISVHYVQKDSATYQDDLLKAFAANKDKRTPV